MSITYENQNGRRKNRDPRFDIDVRRDGKIIGEIVYRVGGWGFIPAGKRQPERYYTSLEELKAALEAAA